MNSLRKILLGAVLAGGALIAFSGCASGGYVGVREDVYYGPRRDPWFHDDPWMDGHHWYRDREPPNQIGIYISPPRRGRW